MELRTKRMLLPVFLVLGMAAAMTLFLFNPSRVPIYPVCVFHSLTGLNCPGCGSLRAMHQLLHGNLMEALRLNAFLVISLPLAAWSVARLWRSNPERPWTVRPLYFWMYAGAWLVFGIVRELPLAVLAAWSP